MSDSPKAGDLATTLATWLFYLDQAGHKPSDEAIAAALDRLSALGKMQAEMLAAAERQEYEEAARIQAELRSPANDPDSLGQALVGAVEASLPGTSADEVLAWGQAQFGSDRIDGNFDGDREARVQLARQTSFMTGLPWLAQIIDRFPDGHVGAHWVMVERVTDQVRCLDPYPWDDLDEELEVPLVDFMVKWELAGCTGLRWS